MKKLIYILIINCSLLTVNCFPQWVEQNSGVTVSLNSVSAVGNVAWVCGNSGTVLKTTNAGENWINVSGSGIPANVNLTCIEQYSPAFVLTAGNIGSNTFLYRTTNGGINWTLVFTQAGGFINAITWVPSVFLIQGNPVGSRWSLWRSANNALTWDSSGTYLLQSGSEMGFSNSLYNDNGKIWFGTNNSRIYYSPNFGSNWVLQSTVPEINTYSVWFEFLLTDNIPGIGFAGGSNLLKTTNQGLNWIQIPSMGSGNILGITGDWTSSSSKKWYIRSNNIYATTNYGSSWNIDYTASTGSYNHISVLRGPPLNVWAVRNNGGISKYPGTIGINIISSEIPGAFLLYQNYRNPFNPITKIKFDIPPVASVHRTDIQLIVYDIIGRKITTLVNEKLHPGTYEANFYGSNLSSGIYFYKLSFDGNIVDTKKMVLIK